jgi:acetyl-CoA synthase
MSKIIATKAIKGAHKIVNSADEILKKTIAQKGKDCPVAYPDTAYYLPFILALMGIKVEKVGDMVKPLEHAKKLLPPVPSDELWLPYLGGTLDSGIATLIGEEIIEALKFVNGPSPVNGIWLGFTNDSILREQGIKLVDGRMPGFAACVGACSTSKEAVRIIRELQEKRILVFISGSTDGVSMAEQLAEEGVEMSWDTYVVPYGKEITATIHALNFAVRAAMTFGGLSPGGLKEARDILLYNKRRVHAFVLALGEVDEEKFATAAGAINFGFPVVADTDIDQILPTGICTYEHVVSPVPPDKMVNKAIEVRGLKIKYEKPDIPVPYGPAFEGERVRREQVAVEFGSKFSKAFEYLRMRDMDEVEDAKITLVGPDIDSIPEGGALPLAVRIDVAGRKMQVEFESILERRIHTFLSEAMGVMHTGQRDQLWVRISIEAKKAGFRLSHFGTILRTKLLSEFPAIVDKVQIGLYTNQADVERLLPEARAAFEVRDKRIADMTDESIDTFYSCQLCQSYAPNHICIISPERLGLCGAYNWFDGKAGYELNPTGGNQPVKKSKTIDEVKGQWEGVNQFVYEKSNKTIETFNAYSIMEYPMTSCGCFECIVAVLPEANGVMIVNRGYPEMTPCGMKFSTLAGSVGGGQQTPGFVGVGRLYIVSKKFLSADGGFLRIVWMPKELKESMTERLKKRCQEIGDPEFLNKIADETMATTSEELVSFLQKVGHPALSMPPLL